jgi:hypothetical protein
VCQSSHTACTVRPKKFCIVSTRTIRYIIKERNYGEVCVLSTHGKKQKFPSARNSEAVDFDE